MIAAGNGSAGAGALTAVIVTGNTELFFTTTALFWPDPSPDKASVGVLAVNAAEGVIGLEYPLIGPKSSVVLYLGVTLNT